MKLDVSTIEGFDKMTDAEKVAALMGMEVPDKVDMSLFVSKDIADKYATEAAELKKQMRTKMSEDEIKKAEEEARYKEIEEKYAELLKKETISTYTAKYLAMGYEQKLAADTAKALAEGNFEKVFANGEKAKAEMEKSIKADILRGTPKPGSFGGADGVTKSDIMKIKDSVERQKAIAENIELFGKEV